MNREQTRKEALEFLQDELRLSRLHQKEQETRGWEACWKVRAASAGIKFWQFWRTIQREIGVHAMARADSERWRLAFREVAIQRAMVTLGTGYAPDEQILDLFQEVANEALMTQVRLVGVGTESDSINARSETVHWLVEALREEHRFAYGRHAA